MTEELLTVEEQAQELARLERQLGWFNQGLSPEEVAEKERAALENELEVTTHRYSAPLQRDELHGAGASERAPPNA